MLLRIAELKKRRGAVAILVGVSLTGLVGITAMVLDGGMLQDNKRRVQAAADASALAAASALYKTYTTLTTGTPDPGNVGKTAALASASSNGFTNDTTNSTVTVHIPPTSGPFTSKVGYAEVIITYQQPRYFSTIWGSTKMPVKARAVARGYWGGSGNGVIVLDPSVKDALDASGQGTVTVTGGASMIVDSNHVEAGRVTGGASAMTAPTFEVTGGTTGVFNGTVHTGTNPIPDPLAYLPQPTKPAAGTMTTKNKSGAKTYTLTPGSYSNLPNFGTGDTVILQQGGIYYIDGGGLTSTGGATIKMDTSTTGGVMIYNAPKSGAQSNSINISGGSVTLSPLTSGPYAGILFFQERTSSVSMSIQGQGGFNITGTFYAANALLSVTGQGNNTIGSQYVSRTLSMSGGGNTLINYTDQGTARTRIIQLVE